MRNTGRRVREDGKNGFEAVVEGHEDGFEDVEDGVDQGAEGVDGAGHGYGVVIARRL